MCTINNKAELERKIEELRKYKAMAEEATSIEKNIRAWDFFIYGRQAGIYGQNGKEGKTESGTDTESVKKSII